MLLVVAVSAANAVFSAEQIDALLFGHNKARRERGKCLHKPDFNFNCLILWKSIINCIIGLNDLTWNVSIAAFAQSYSDQCIWGHVRNFTY